MPAIENVTLQRRNDPDTLDAMVEVSKAMCRNMLEGVPGCVCQGDPHVCIAQQVYGGDAVAAITSLLKAGFVITKPAEVGNG